MILINLVEQNWYEPAYYGIDTLDITGADYAHRAEIYEQLDAEIAFNLGEE